MKNGTLPINLNHSATRLVCFFIWIIHTSLLITGCNSMKENTVQTKNPNGRNDTWGFAGYGGGGAMFYPASKPAQF